ncbi:MAG: acetyl-CoA carboxylase biotin carboxyl carrier protein [Chloroflexi bacterium]|nr:acetyl-CoA carboxylase biotin carboxyl carrier protein [Chloroflexota bacterium]
MKDLLARLRDGDLTELEVRQGALRVKVSKATAAVVAEPSGPAATGGADAARGDLSAARAPATAKADAKTVVAPLTGVFYRSGSPQAPPFVQVGTVVRPGDVIGLIEAMKLFNEVRSTVTGRVKRIPAETGKLVRAHEPLVELE